MRSKKLFSIAVLLLFVTMMITSEGGQYNNDVNTWNDNVPSSVQTDSIVGQPQVIELNASVETVIRNMTIRTTSRLILEDNIKIIIHDNVTEIGSFNISLPTEFDQNVIKSTFYSKFDSDFGLIASKNIKPFTKYVGQNVTTYSVDIRVNDTLANNTLDGVYVYARFETLNSITFEGVGAEIQRGVFTSPIIPTYPNLEVKDALIGVRLQADQDRFNRDFMENIVVDGVNYPILRSLVLLEWRNMTREAFEPVVGFVEDYDYTKIVFDSVIPDDPTITQSATVDFAFTEATRLVRIDPWGVVHITETMTMIHLGAPRPENATQLNLNFQIVGFTMQFNEHTKILSAFDEIGRLNVGEHEDGFPKTPQPENGIRLFNLNFRTPIYGGETYTFTVDYEINASRIISTENGVSTLNTTLFSLYNTTIYDLKTIYELPAGSTFISTNFIPQSPISKVSMSTVIERNALSYFNHLELHIDIINATHLDNFAFVIVYDYNGLGHFQYLITFILSVFALVAVVVLLKQINLKESMAVQLEKEKIPMDEITRFFDNFSEVRSASDTIIELKVKRKGKKLSQKDYASQVKKVKIRLRNQKEILEKAIADLAKHGGRYKRLSERIVFAYKKLEDTQSNISNTNRSYAKKDISKDLYYKLLKEYNEEVDKQESIINRSLSELSDIVNQFE